jgi:alpha-D-ribose 1-methylphosphonate 5-phosphate C-P lyase
MDALMPTHTDRELARTVVYISGRRPVTARQTVTRWEAIAAARAYPRNVTGRFFLDSSTLAAEGAVEGDKLG